MVVHRGQHRNSRTCHPQTNPAHHALEIHRRWHTRSLTHLLDSIKSHAVEVRAARHVAVGVSHPTFVAPPSPHQLLVQPLNHGHVFGARQTEASRADAHMGRTQLSPSVDQGRPL